jgi:hypothetical protein
LAWAPPAPPVCMQCALCMRDTVRSLQV